MLHRIMHGLCMALLGFASLDAVSTATWAQPGVVLEHCSGVLNAAGVNEDEAALLQTGAFKPRSDVHDSYGSKYGGYRPSGRDKYPNLARADTTIIMAQTGWTSIHMEIFPKEIQRL